MYALKREREKNIYIYILYNCMYICIINTLCLNIYKYINYIIILYYIKP